MSKHLHLLALLILILPVSYVVLWTTAYQELDIDDHEFAIEGFMGEEFEFSEIDTILLVNELPKIYSSAGISLKGYEKGFFTRFSDQRKVKIIAHHKELYLKIVCKNGEVVYYNADTKQHTKETFQKLTQLIFKS
ncbi:MAG: hypothetical protein ACPGSD_06085 [Flavobacteriales bacterium]